MKIEELTDHLENTNITSPQPEIDLFSAALNYGASKQNGSSTADTTTPGLPPAMADARSKTTEQILADLNEHPLFMTELQENDGLEAIRALAYEGTPAEVADGFRERGNECFREKGWKDGKEFYTKGVDVLLLEIRRRQRGEEPKEGVSDSKEEVQKELKILEGLLVNRAAAHLELKNYRSTTLDCTHALLLNPTNIKALYRLSRAYFFLDKIPEADDACARGLALDPDNKSLKDIAQKIIKRNEEVSARKKREQERELRKRKEEITLKAALKARGIKLRWTGKEPDTHYAKIELQPDPIDPTSAVVFPTVLLYPLHLESDFIKAFAETENLQSLLGEILPLPWDTKGEYGGGKGTRVECFMETTKGGLIKVGKKVSLLSVLGMKEDGSENSVEVVDGLVRVMVVPKTRVDEWVGEWKRKKALETKT